MSAAKEERRLQAASEYWGIPVEQLRAMPVHAKDCSLVTTHHLTCSCGAYNRAKRAGGGS